MPSDRFWKTRLVLGEVGKAIKSIIKKPDRTSYDLPMGIPSCAHLDSSFASSGQGTETDAIRGDAVKEYFSRRYPRPQMVRDSYFDLNGEWELEGSKIRVPFPPQANCSGYEGIVSDTMMYRKVFELPEGFWNEDSGERVLLHFGAVDQVAEVWLNDQFLGKHEGGYLPFTFDVTEMLRQEDTKASKNMGARINLDKEERVTSQESEPRVEIEREITHQELKVRVTDELNPKYPYGKQTKNPGGMWYTPVTGIWQSVWMECVPKTYIESVVCNYEEPNLVIEITGNADAYEMTLLSDAEEDISIILKNGRNTLSLDFLKQPIFWSPENPKLYHFELKVVEKCLEKVIKEQEEASLEETKVTCICKDEHVDSVHSYFALRTISIEYQGGHNRLCLNHEPYFFHAVLDQGYYSQGLLTPPSDAWFEEDIRNMKELGFNTLRKHLKVEPARFYYDCDRLGMVVFQDMVNNGEYKYLRDTISPTFFGKAKAELPHIHSESQQFFLQHAKDTVRYLKGFPCILLYTVFNEGWGQFASGHVTEELKKLDDSRIYDSTSGWFWQNTEDILSDHAYFHTIWHIADPRPRIQSECGGFTRPIEGHMFRPGLVYGYGGHQTEAELTDRIVRMYEDEVVPKIKDGMSGCVYTQLSDVEEEINGLYTYDRAVCKVNKERMADLGKLLEDTVKLHKNY